MKKTIVKDCKINMFERRIVIISTDCFTGDKDNFYRICVTDKDYCCIAQDCYDNIIEVFACEGSTYLKYILQALCLISLTRYTPNKNINVDDAVDIVDQFFPNDLSILNVILSLKDICDLRKVETIKTYL